MFELDIWNNNTLRTTAALYGCSMCPPPEGCPDEPYPIDQPIREFAV